jgi:hypothetical protein
MGGGMVGGMAGGMVGGKGGRWYRRGGVHWGGSRLHKYLG